MMSALVRQIGPLVIIAIAAMSLLSLISFDKASSLPQWSEIEIDPATPRSPWGKASGDINGDGRLDLVVGGHAKPKPGLWARIANKLNSDDASVVAGELVWYEAPDWRRHQISTAYRIRTDLEVADLDQDGHTDIIALTDSGVVHFRGPSWEPVVISAGQERKWHDIEVDDLDRDGDLDIVLRSQSRFGYDDGDHVHILHNNEKAWSSSKIAVPHGEGLRVSAVDADAYPDIVVNDIWLRNPGEKLDTYWESIDYTSHYDWPDVFIDVADINSDGRPDIVVSPAEPVGEHYRISWFEGPADNKSAWHEHIIEPVAEAVHHFVGVGDFDGNGAPDVFTAKMNQGSDPDDIAVYLQCGPPDNWKRMVLSDQGSHSMQVVDLDQDGDDEVVGADWQIDGYHGDYALTMWNYDGSENCGWRRHLVGDNPNKKQLFVRAADLNADGLLDLAAGPAWFENPGDWTSAWPRHDVGRRFGNVVLAWDIDGDRDMDLFGSAFNALHEAPGIIERVRAKVSDDGFPGSAPGGSFVWAENDGSGEFVVHQVAAIEGDYLQGAAVDLAADGASVFLSWHRPGMGLQRLTVTDNAATDPWPVNTVSAFSQDEQITLIDLDGDKRADIITGTAWLKALPDDVSFRTQWISDEGGKPDRHVLGDVNGDGELDLVVGFESPGEPGPLILYSGLKGQRTDSELIDRPIGPMSLGVGDMNLDSTTDLVVGEHHLHHPERSRLLSYTRHQNRWIRRVLATGDEHHNGALIADFDNDGDLDIASIGWTHGRVLVYENPAL